MHENDLQRELGQGLVDEVNRGRMTRRELLVRGTVLGLSMTTIGSLLAACGSSSTSGSTVSASASASVAPKAGGTLRVTMVPPTGALDPVVMYDAGAIATVQQVCEYLAWAENDLRLRPVLAESWTPDATAQTWTFKLRQNVTFNNGQPFTADDVVATFKRLCDPKSGSSALSNFAGILSSSGISKVDDFTVQFALDRAFVDFPYLVSSSNYNCVVLPKNYTDFEKQKVGTGPFTLDSYTLKQKAVLKKNPTYWQQGLPYLDGVTITYADEQAQTLALQSGAQDLQLSTPFQGSQPLFSDPRIKVVSTPSTQMREVQMRVDKPPFDNKNVRQAIAYCLDRPAILQGLFNGKGLIGNDNVFCPLYPIGVKIPQRAQDYAKAKQLLSAAGVTTPLKLTLIAEEYLEVPQYAQVIQQQCKPAGIEITIQPQTQAQYYGSNASAPWLTAPFAITDWAARAIPSQFFIPMLTSKGIWNSSHWKDPQFDKLAQQYDATLDEAKRRDIGVQMATIETDETPIIIAYWIEALRATGSNVYGVEANGAEYLDLTHAFLA